MDDICQTRASAGMRGIPCDGPNCVYWRVAGHLDLVEGVDEGGCAIQQFEILGRNDEVVRWLISVKQRLEAQAAESDDAAVEGPLVFPDA